MPEFDRSGKVQETSSNSEGSVFESFVHNLMWSGAQAPMLGATQLIDKTTEKLSEITGVQAFTTNLAPRFDVLDPPKQHEFLSPNWAADQAGSVAGSVAFLLFLNRFSRVSRSACRAGGVGSQVFEGVRKLQQSEAMSSALVGAAYGGVFQPVSDNANFWTARMQNAIVDGGTLGIMSKVQSAANLRRSLNLPSMARADHKVLNLLYLEYPQPLRHLAIARHQGLARLAVDKAVSSEVFTGAMSGVTGGMFNVQARSLLERGHLTANWSELQEPLLTYGIFGGIVGRAAKSESITRLDQLGRNTQSTYSGSGGSSDFSNIGSLRARRTSSPLDGYTPGAKLSSESLFDKSLQFESHQYPTRMYSGEPKSQLGSVIEDLRPGTQSRHAESHFPKAQEVFKSSEIRTDNHGQSASAATQGDGSNVGSTKNARVGVPDWWNLSSPTKEVSGSAFIPLAPIGRNQSDQRN